MMKNSQSTKRARIHKPTKEFVKQEEPDEPTNEFLEQDEAVDRLSALPDKLLLHILSSLDTKEVARTSSLSKRWQFLWTDSSEFHLLETSSDIEKIRHFVHSVGKMLFMCSGIHLEKFTVNFRFDESVAPNVNLWVQFLVKNKVKYITLHCRFLKESYVLPQVLYSNSSLTNLTIGHCSILPRGAIAWGSLKSLCLNTVELIDTVLDKILAGCPVLSFLTLIACRGFNHLRICSPSLTKLTLENWITCATKNGSALEISAPYVEVLCISANYSIYYKLKNIKSCVRACLHFKPEVQVIPEDTMYDMQQHLESLHYVKELELGSLYVEIISRLEEKGCNKLPFSNLLCLTLTAWSHKRSIPGILALLRSSPKLKTLVIRGFKVAPHQIHDQAEAYLRLPKDLLLRHLQTVKISGFTQPGFDGEPMLSLVQLLLKSAMNLEKIVIDAKDMDANGFSIDFAKIAMKLLPRTSPDAVVVIR